MKRGFWLIAIVAALLAGLRAFPLSWAAAAVPAEMGRFSGTIWNGQVRGVPLLGAATLKTGLDGVRVASAPGDVALQARLTPGALHDVSLSLPVARLPITDARLAGLSGRISVQADAARFKDQSCLSATGTASTDVLRANSARLGWAGPVLEGPVDCIDGALRVRLSGEDPDGRVGAIVLTRPDGTYQSDITVTTDDPAAGNVLALFGFSPTGEAGQYRLLEQGRWR